LHFNQNLMDATIWFFLRLNRDLTIIFIIYDELRSVVDEYPLIRTAGLVPRVLFVVELESHDKDDHLVNIDANMPLIYQSAL
jgi:hypothetical protein